MDIKRRIQNLEQKSGINKPRVVLIIEESDDTEMSPAEKEKEIARQIEKGKNLIII